MELVIYLRNHNITIFLIFLSSSTTSDTEDLQETPPPLPPKNSKILQNEIAANSIPIAPVISPYEEQVIDEETAKCNTNNQNESDSPQSPSSTVEIEYFPSILEELDITGYLIFDERNEEIPEVKGGPIDALIVHACSCEKS